jgi:hypothetical protein
MAPEPDWSSLPSDLVHRIGDHLLSTNDIDYYMGMRTVCHNWRSATADPRRTGGVGADLLRFRPRRWVMLEEEPKDDGDDTRLFVNLTTGRFLRLRLPLLRDHILVATSDGLLVLGHSKLPLAICIINPFTGSMFRFATRMPCDHVIAGVTGSSDPTLIFSFDVRYGEKVCCADPTSAILCEQPFPRGQSYIANIATHEGHVYMVDVQGLVARSVGTVKHRRGSKVVAETLDVVACPREPHGMYNFFLVESVGELLLVRRE